MGKFASSKTLINLHSSPIKFQNQQEVGEEVFFLHCIRSSIKIKSRGAIMKPFRDRRYIIKIGTKINIRKWLIGIKGLYQLHTREANKKVRFSYLQFFCDLLCIKRGFFLYSHYTSSHVGLDREFGLWFFCLKSLLAQFLSSEESIEGE